jgi:hypothetical protein
MFCRQNPLCCGVVKVFAPLTKIINVKIIFIEFNFIWLYDLKFDLNINYFLLKYLFSAHFPAPWTVPPGVAAPLAPPKTTPLLLCIMFFPMSPISRVHLILIH